MQSMVRVEDVKCIALCLHYVTGSHLALFLIWHNSEGHAQAPVENSKFATNVCDAQNEGLTSDVIFGLQSNKATELRESFLQKYP